MDTFNKTEHWENIYKTKQLTEVSWYQPIPYTSLELIKDLNIPKNAKIIDIGGGDSFLVDSLLESGYRNISVLDISKTAIEKAKQRLCEKSNIVKWIIADVASFQPIEKYDLWHDRAVFHFLTNIEDQKSYFGNVIKNINPGGNLIIGTFSETGPKKCSGIEIKQYSETSLNEMFKPFFKKIKCFEQKHVTPFNTIQNFIFCCFIKL